MSSEKTAIGPPAGAGALLKPASRAPARIASFSRPLSGLDAGRFKDVEPDKLKDDIRRWAKAVVSLVRQLSIGAAPESS